jgi:hypothetical protein
MAAASSGAAQSTPWLPRLRLDNDAYNFWKLPAHRPDEEYTNGVRVTFESLRATRWSRWLGGGHRACGTDTGARANGSCVIAQVAIGQDLYTPNLSRPPFQAPDWEDERPYAAWLYLMGTARTISARTLRTVDLSLGVTGSPALGELSQRIAHKITRGFTEEARGWETQVGFEPAAMLSLRQEVLAVRAAAGGKGVADFAPFAGFSLGNVRTAAEIGGRLRLGYNVSHPWDSRGWRGRSPLEFFVAAGGRLSYVARDFSLDGALFRQGRRVERVPVVAEHEFGLGLRMHALSIGWTATLRGREYRTGPRYHPFSSMTAAWEVVP